VTRTSALLCAAATATIAGAVLTGCSSSSGPAAAPSCGTTHTAVGVPVIIKVAKGSVGCSTALSVENKYSALIKSGHVRGNGGGAPVSVNGWTCQGYLTPQILATGDASECHVGNTEIVAVLPVPTPTSTSLTSG
jgi:hypothetical protein